ncbi:hypothetical protein [Leptothrix discophora]|uniref:Tetratricopeptide repeat protein n=1 Tax=Leptothrix discophora TaxID=89 RepID=A0ABT9G7J7_LEPDI|nr:hypothetical protein [Leptothrix discophora]MDP4302450.1 hypothetical protein [Leptothrix discophora]
MATLLGLGSATATASDGALPAPAALPFFAWTPAQRAERFAAAEDLLRAGDAPGALAAWEALALREHSADIELGIVRSQMQDGELRRATTFSAHTAGVHRQDVAGSAVYGWLLALGGQRAAARQRVDAALQRHPDAALLQAVRERIDQPHPALGAGMRELPHRLAPLSTGVVPDRPVQAVASALLLGDGAQALLPADRLLADQPVWLRDGLGRTVRGWPLDDDAPVLRRFRLDPPLPPPPALQLAARDPFPGSPALSVLHGPSPDGEPAWPWLNQVFLGLPDAQGRRPLGLVDPQALVGGPVFDLSGVLVGVALGRADGTLLLRPASALSVWRERAGWGHAGPVTGPGTGTPGGAAPVARLPYDEVHERALRLTLQVLQPR